MDGSTIPYYVVEERKKLNRCIEEAPNDYEKEIYRAIRNMPVPYEKLNEILYLIFDYPHKHYTFKYFEV